VEIGQHKVRYSPEGTLKRGGARRGMSRGRTEGKEGSPNSALKKAKRAGVEVKRHLVEERFVSVAWNAEKRVVRNGTKN